MFLKVSINFFIESKFCSVTTGSLNSCFCTLRECVRFYINFRSKLTIT